MSRLQLLALIAGTVVSSSAYGQSAPEAAPQKIPASSAQLSSQNQTTIEKSIYGIITAWRYRFFIEYVGRENAVIERHNGDDSERVPRTDYESAIGIGDGEEQAILEIVLDASAQMIETWDQMDARTLQLLENHSLIEQIDDDATLKALGRQQMEIVNETRANLMRDIGEKTLKKLDAYVFQEFINRKRPLSLSHTDPDLSEIESTPSDREPGRGPSYKAKLRQLYAFADFFEVIGTSGGSRQTGSTGRNSGGSLPACTPAKDMEAVRRIVRNAHDQMRLVNAREDADIGQYHKNSDPGPIPYPLPSELEMEAGRFWAAVDSGIKNLKRQLGDAEFAKFDHAVDEVFGPGLWKEASSATQLADAQH